jgi:hypothetical protein
MTSLKERFSYNDERFTTVSCMRFLEMHKNKNIELIRTRIIPPRLGENDFGSIEVCYRIKALDVTYGWK